MPSRTAAERAARTLSRLAALAAVACAMLVAPAPAAAQNQSPTPSGAELRRTYPLNVKPSQSVRAAQRTPVATSAPAKRTSASGSAVSVPLFLLLALAAFAAGFAITVRPLRLRRAPEPREAGEESAVVDGLPPAPTDRWTAEMHWGQDGDACVFTVVARSATDDETAVIARSQPLDWPPVGAAAVEHVTAAADELERSLVSSGWRPLPPGDAWYAKRFAWEPAPRPGRFDRRGTLRSRAVHVRRNGAS